MLLHLTEKTNILQMSITLAKRPDQDLNDLAYVKIGTAVLVNQPYVPDAIRQAINNCNKITKPLFHQAFNNIAQFSYSFVIVVVPVKLSFTLSAEMGVDLVATLCPSKLVLNVGVEPWFTLSVKADAGISIMIATGGVSVTASFNYRLKPSVGTSNCNVCAILAQTIQPISIQVSAFVEAIIIGRKDYTIYKYDGPTINNELFRKCLTNGKYDPDGTIAGTTPVQPDPNAQPTDQTGATPQPTTGDTSTTPQPTTGDQSSGTSQSYPSSNQQGSQGNNQGSVQGVYTDKYAAQWDYLFRVNAYNAQQWSLYEQRLWQFNQQKRCCNSCCSNKCGKKKCSNGCGKKCSNSCGKC